MFQLLLSKLTLFTITVILRNDKRHQISDILTRLYEFGLTGVLENILFPLPPTTLGAIKNTSRGKRF